jgi:hypothetical protein
MRIGWWLYFWFIAINLITTPFIGSFDFASALWFLFGLLCLIGLWGYLEARPVGHRLLWAAVFVSIAISLGYFAIRPFVTETVHFAWSLYGATVGIVLSAPLLLAIWRYSFSSPSIWRTSPVA